MKTTLFLSLLALSCGAARVAGAATDVAAEADPTQVPRAMHAPMKERPHITVGQRAGDIIGGDNRALQAAVDYVAGLGGGTVAIGPGEYIMRDSLHLRSQVAVRGTPGQTVLRKAPSTASPLKLDGDYGEEQITVADPTGFGIGDGVAVWDKNSGGFHTTVARITGASGNTMAISLPLNADCMVENGAQAATVFPVVSGYYAEGARIEDLIIDGNKEKNVPLNGCRGGGIFLYRCHGAVLERCLVRNYNGDGISFQQCNDVLLAACVSEGNTGLGLHPGSGSQRPVLRQCVARHNGQDGLFLCWRVKQGLFEDNLLEDNLGFGISVGHKDTDNLFRNNQVRRNHGDGVFFRNETEGMAPHRNRLENNLIENNGLEEGAAGIRVRGQTRDLVLKHNTLRDTRPAGERKQTVGIKLEEKVGRATIQDNQIEAPQPIEDQRRQGTGER
ncbi:MAG TPA: right-handed parallel beta-helix repeat-containing protein [Dongiaceae bacterium]|nr:right-handed parallel beta-helix repeat-containing protein [Dongiaceae bacterium]